MQHQKLLFANYVCANSTNHTMFVLIAQMITHQAWFSQEIHASVAVLLAPGSYMMRHFRAMCSEKRQDFPATRDDYNVMALQSKQMHEKVAAHKVGNLHVYTTSSLHGQKC